MTINRKLFSGETPCSAKCAYCFAKWPAYVGQDVISVWNNEEIGPIVYPCCDSDINGTRDLTQQLWKIAENNHSTYISISTKNVLAADLLDQYEQLNRYLSEHQKGFVKIGVSVTNKYRIGELEPGTDSYERRRELFVDLQQRGFETSLVFKPILPFIPSTEYREIVTDYSMCDYFLLGSLYVDPKSEFYHTYIYDQYDVQEKTVSWLDAHPRWQCISQDIKLHAIAQFIQEQGKGAFYTDTDLISQMVKDRKAKL